MYRAKIREQTFNWVDRQKMYSLLIWLVNFFNIFLSPNYVLKVFKKTFVMRSLRFWFHKWNLLNFTLATPTKKISEHIKTSFLFKLQTLHKNYQTWRIKKRLLSRSTPFPFSFLVTSVKLLGRSLIKYLEELSRKATRLITKSLPETASYDPSSCNKWKYIHKTEIDETLHFISTKLSKNSDLS